MGELTEKPRGQLGSIFSTPWAIVLLGLLLWIAAGAAAVLAATGLDHLAPQLEAADRLTTVSTSYLLYAPSVMLALLGLVVLLVGAVRCGIYGRNARGVPAEAERQELTKLLQQVNDRLLLSETAKRILYREHDLQAMRELIEQDIAGGNFDAAMALVKELTETYGQREEAEAYRDRIAAARHHIQKTRIAEAIRELDTITNRQEFDNALREAAKIQRLYPEAEEVKDLKQRVIDAREEYKHQLERKFLEVARAEDVDRALELLKELDQYLTESEAEPLREVARGVIGKKRDNLGVQFKMAVHDHEWLQAVNIGEQIVREFPNSRMAEEVRGMIDALRQRAADQHAAQSGTT